MELLCHHVSKSRTCGGLGLSLSFLPFFVWVRGFCVWFLVDLRTKKQGKNRNKGRGKTGVVAKHSHFLCFFFIIIIYWGKSCAIKLKRILNFL
jgi:hypothetical protein